ncbi:hypothetical protein [Chondromyces crocatus]|uniref:Lipoprotein n=1 Tax=Chondromyces crocatus TaxID=52 RepID=A0A0K1ET90_CHOCO|nr:hypothetical protein [Chondromyces crocatus]AKT44135.1 uncharacterized protein CMC5_083750 [Chondromyces crocatus]
MRVLLLATVLLVGCGAGVTATGPRHDMPVPRGVARAEVALRVDLRPGPGCEEVFDLALYEDRGVDLVQWDRHAGVCKGRSVTIRYLPRQLSEGALLEAVRKLTTRVEKVGAARETER